MENETVSDIDKYILNKMGAQDTMFFCLFFKNLVLINCQSYHKSTKP